MASRLRWRRTIEHDAARSLRELNDEAKADRQRRGVCACGHTLAMCGPERCSHKFAHNALGLGDEP